MEAQNQSCCNVQIDSIVTVGERGQVLLPKDLREKAGIESGDKLAVISCNDENGVCCITLMKSDQLVDKAKEVLGPLVQELNKS